MTDNRSSAGSVEAIFDEIKKFARSSAPFGYARDNETIERFIAAAQEHLSAAQPQPSAGTGYAALPCPFCGRAPQVAANSQGGSVYCDSPDCFGPRTTAGYLVDALAQWNKRSNAPAQAPAEPTYKCGAGCRGACNWPCCDCDPKANEIKRGLLDDGWTPPDQSCSAGKATPYWICCNCDAPLSCAACGVEQPDDSEHYRKLQEENDRLRALPQEALNPGLTKAMEIVGEMRMSEAGIFDEKHSGQRGEDRSNALYDAYVAIRSAVTRPHQPSQGEG